MIEDRVNMNDVEFGDVITKPTRQVLGVFEFPCRW